MKLFLPPEFNPPVAWFADAALPGILRNLKNIHRVEISTEDRQMLRSLRDERLLFFSNHPTQAEPVIAYHVANVMGSRFNYMATRRAFDHWFGALGKLFQSVGVYSVIPGAPDRESMRMTRSILAKARGKLVIFPEGEPMGGENDNLLPFQPGVVRLAFSGLEDARKVDADADIKLLPGFVKYVTQGTQAEIKENLEGHIASLENKLGARPGERNLLRRFLMVGRLLLEKVEGEYGIQVENPDDFEFRIGRVRHVILDRTAEELGIKNYDPQADAIHKLRHLFTVLELMDINYPDPGLPRLSVEQRAAALNQCITAYDFIVIKREYLVSNPTPERFFEWLTRFESLALGKTSRALGGEPYHMPTVAHVRFAKPFGIGEYYERYKQDRRNVPDLVLGRLREQLVALMQDCMQLSEPLVTPGDLGTE